MEEKELRQLFKNLSDCYADTWIDIGIEMQQGEVIQAMTEDRFIETLKEAKLLAAPAVSVSVLDEVRQAFSDYRRAEGCSCCRDQEAHLKAEKGLLNY